MQRIFNALVQFRNPILYFVLLGTSLLFLNNRSNFHQSQLHNYSLYFSQSLYGVSHRISNYFQLKKINDQLLQENRALKELELKSNGIALYPTALKTKRRFPFQVKAAHVIKNSFLNQQNYLIIDKGAKDGIEEEMAVITDRGIIGIVKTVSEHYASVISILNQDLKINVRLKKNPAFGTLSWKGKNPIDFQVEDIVMNAGLEKGDTLITGGMSSYFPLGIPLGKITDFERNIQSGYYTISTELFEDPSQVYYVYVIENLEVKEINGLNKELPK
jgi:rod shape-determining protein MreC